MTFWKFDREKGRIDPGQSFAIELPPYWQDLADAGKGPSDGWSFSTRSTPRWRLGGIEEGKPPFEAGASRTTWTTCIINWKKAEEVVANGGGEDVKGMSVIRIADAVDEGLLYPGPRAEEPARRRRHARTASTWSSPASSTRT